MEEWRQRAFVSILGNSIGLLVSLRVYQVRKDSIYPTKEVTDEDDHNLLTFAGVRPVEALEGDVFPVDVEDR